MDMGRSTFKDDDACQKTCQDQTDRSFLMVTDIGRPRVDRHAKSGRSEQPNARSEAPTQAPTDSDDALPAVM